jgi:hypothetical protein
MKTIGTNLKLFIFLLAIAALSPVASAAMLVEYKFETTAANTGTLLAAADGTLFGTATWSTDTPSGSGSSLSLPIAHDTARVSTSGALSAFDNLGTITGLMWLKPTTIATADRLLSSWDGANGFDLKFDTPNIGTFAANN